MAKVTITIEDSLGPDGSAGVILQWDSTDEEDERSLANGLAAKFVQDTVGEAGVVKDLMDPDNFN